MIERMETIDTQKGAQVASTERIANMGTLMEIVVILLDLEELRTRIGEPWVVAPPMAPHIVSLILICTHAQNTHCPQ